ncbi:UNVERIFIED_CONTAM: Chitinase-like protein 1 [Sesamum calycinum]|uniref:Chitinase-like protein 1 n=1 Tax=Sesamum calycinum TaxID=2727403 RepID=A0AAW2QLF8_9LAMI
MYLIGGYGVATGGPLAWGLCYNKEMSPSQDYCDEYYKYDYPCAPGAQYYGRGAIPIYCNGRSRGGPSHLSHGEVLQRVYGVGDLVLSSYGQDLPAHDGFVEPGSHQEMTLAQLLS